MTNLRNGRSVVVRINDRGPFVRGRGLDLARGAAFAIGMYGVGPVRIAVLGRGRSFAAAQAPSPNAWYAEQEPTQVWRGRHRLHAGAQGHRVGTRLDRVLADSARIQSARD